jgi:predicted nucleic-acid-binding protein
LELLWVLRAIYGFDRRESLEALELLTQLPVLELEDHDAILDLVRLGRSTRADLPDLLIGLAGRSAGAGTTLTFEKGLAATGLFRRLAVPSS